MRERHDAIYVFRQLFVLEAARDRFRRVRRAVARRHDRNIVACAHASVLARISKEFWRLGAMLGWRDLRSGKLILELQFLECQVVRVDVLPGAYRLLGAADGVAVAMHHFARRNVAQRDLVPRRDLLPRHEPRIADFKFQSRGNVDAGDCDVVLRMQTNG